ncbi:MAG TPA: 30S ribosomal protein S12 methylthiotransferase RimO [Gemmatimonadaceae bacterium]|nr:30S ribosomal protein S12 methylthiotransferase RimO [Gemmatimonadaceae bacterium]
MKIGFITLGCDKNTVDSERCLADLVHRGAQYTADLDEADVIVVNTCGFIDAAKQESIDALVQAGQYKTRGSCQAVVAVGCMVQRHKGELEAELPEVDLFLGASEMDRLGSALQERGVLNAAPDPVAEHPGVRLYTGDLPHVRYLKVSEGCDHGCAFCAIPLMRGKHRSFALNAVVREAQLLETQGAREVNLVAQDLAHYGRDRRAEGARLPELLEALVAETSIPWIRMLYLYSAGITPRLLEVMAREPRILPYLDMPIQHASDPVLERMRRPERAHTLREKIARIRQMIPDVAIRTTCIVGFPGEKAEDFQRLLDFLEEMRFERVGAFTYSPQEGTRAALLEDTVPEALKLDRLERLADLQSAISAERYERFVGRVVPAIVDRAPAAGEPAVARVLWQADDIDGITWLDGEAPAGALVDAAIESVVDDVNFRASLVQVRSVPATITRRDRSGARRLPVMATIGNGSFGR